MTQYHKGTHRLVIYLDPELYGAFLEAAAEEEMSLHDAAVAAVDGWVQGDGSLEEEEAPDLEEYEDYEE